MALLSNYQKEYPKAEATKEKIDKFDITIKNFCTLKIL